MYVSDEALFRFKRLKYQLNRLKTRKGIDKYSNIESNKKKYITFNKFCNECENYFSYIFIDEPTSITIQEVFDYLDN